MCLQASFFSFLFPFLLFPCWEIIFHYLVSFRVGMGTLKCECSWVTEEPSRDLLGPSMRLSPFKTMGGRKHVYIQSNDQMPSSQAKPNDKLRLRNHLPSHVNFKFIKITSK